MCGPGSSVSIGRGIKKERKKEKNLMFKFLDKKLVENILQQH
jgi:hypothetical protein